MIVVKTGYVTVISSKKVDAPMNFEAPVVFKSGSGFTCKAYEGRYRVFAKNISNLIESDGTIGEMKSAWKETIFVFETQLNSNSSANFRRRRHKRMSANASKILSRRFGGMLHYYKQLR